MNKRGRKVRDLSVEKFGKLLPLYDTGKRSLYSGNAIWMCLCDCGNFKEIASKKLVCNKIRSCGCLKKGRHLKHGYATKKNGKRVSRLYQIWSDIKTRCYNIKSSKYKWYGKRGIIMCDEWKNDFVTFKNWALKNGYQDNLTIDKIDNDKGYYPNNCQWLTQSENITKYWHKDKK